MHDHDWADLRRRLQPRWTDERAARVRASIHRQARRRRVLRIAFALAVLPALLGVPALLRRSRVWISSSATVPTMASAAPAPGAALPSPRLPVATPLTPDTELVVDPEAFGRGFLLRKGGARFVVVHDERRLFRVRAGPLVIEDLGTTFTVLRMGDGRFDVAVEQGRVGVRCGAISNELAQGEHRVFECASQDSNASADAVASRDGSAATQTAHHPAVPAWRHLVESGHYGEAYDSLRRAGSASVRDEAEDLLLAADAARLSGHASDAVPYLEQVLSAHRSDPRVRLAAFTLGRVLLDELGRPGEAAEAFERAREAGSPLAEDALAREVEAYSRAGDTARARGLAQAYQAEYPNGRRARAVAKFGGLE
jgi:transmembrane sensor